MTTEGVRARSLGSATALVILAALVLGACSGSSTIADSSAAAPANAGSGAAVGGTTAAPGTTAAVVKPPVPSAGCKAGTLDAVDYDKQTMTVAGMDRFYDFSR